MNCNTDGYTLDKMLSPSMGVSQQVQTLVAWTYQQGCEMDWNMKNTSLPPADPAAVTNAVISVHLPLSDNSFEAAVDPELGELKSALCQKGRPIADATALFINAAQTCRSALKYRPLPCG
jgi:hypothetical protein